MARQWVYPSACRDHWPEEGSETSVAEGFYNVALSLHPSSATGRLASVPLPRDAGRPSYSKTEIKFAFVR